jgi:hypothetical protein
VRDELGRYGKDRVLRPLEGGKEHPNKKENKLLFKERKQNPIKINLFNNF